MARSPAALDPFNAIAEPRRRQVIETLGPKERAVNELVGLLGWSQPAVSKHLGVLKEVGLVKVRRVGRQRLYRLDAEPLKSVHDWTATFERYWKRFLTQVKEHAEATQGDDISEEP